MNVKRSEVSLAGNINRVKAAQDNQYTTYNFDYYRGPGFLVPVHIPLNRFSTSSRQHNNRTENLKYKRALEEPQ